METVKIAKTFICVNCDYKCYKESNFIKHKLTVKHKKTENETEKFQSSKIPIKFICECGNEYKQRQGLWAHKRKCVFNKEEEPEKNNEIINLLIENNKQLQDENKEFKNIIIQLLTENKEQTKITQEQTKITQEQTKITQEQTKITQAQNSAILELTKNGINSNNTNINNTTNKTTFNLNFFLNDTCKNAVNITDFFNSIQLTYLDFINVGINGYIRGISQIFNNNMKNFSEIERPIHCTDEKRGTIYIKDNNKWEKDDDDSKKLNSLISKIATKNFREVTSYKKKFPDCTKSSSKHSDIYNKSLVEAMGGAGDNENEKKEKIKKSILKTVLIKTK
jgi:hypothetical protein